ncbi:MAG: hypothetical protein ACN4GR_17360 [Arenicellales bacterium]
MSVWDIDSSGNATIADTPAFGYHSSRMLPVNYCALDGTTISADRPDNGNIKISNIASADPDLYFNNPSHSLSITVALAALQTVSAIGMHHDLGYSGEIRARLYRGTTLVADIIQAAHLPLYDWGEAPGWDMMEWEGYPLASDPEAIRRPYTTMWFSEVIADKLVLDISDTAAITINHVSVGLAWTPEVGHNWGDYIAPAEAAPVSKTSSGASLITPEPGENKLFIKYDRLADNDIHRLRNILLLSRQRGEPLYASLYPGRGGQREQQGMVLFYPESWDEPRYGRARGSFSVRGVEIMAYSG